MNTTSGPSIHKEALEKQPTASPTTDICFLSTTALGNFIRQREISPVEIVQAYLERIAFLNPAINAYTHVLQYQALQGAKQAEKDLMQNRPLGLLHGIPLAVKDLFDFLAGVPSTFGLQYFVEHPFVPAQSSTYIQRLLDAGAIALGKTNTPALGFYGATDNRVFGPTSTPYNLAMNAGGSSGGSAAAVASGMTCISQGSDAGGSIRIPAALCGVVGFKPTFGRIPQNGPPEAFHAGAPYLHVGPITRSVEDCALLMHVMAGFDKSDPFCLPDSEENYIAAAQTEFLKGIRIAYSPDLGSFPVQQEVRTVIEGSLAVFRDAGAHVEQVDVRLPSHHDMAALWERLMGVLDGYTMQSFKRSGFDLLADKEALDPRLLARIRATEQMSAVDVMCEGFLRTEIWSALQAVFADYDLLITPTLCISSIPNATNGDLTVGPSQINGEEVDPLIGWSLTYPFNFTGHPAISIPAGMTAQGFPVGMQLVGRKFHDTEVIAASAAFERRHPWQQTYPR